MTQYIFFAITVTSFILIVLMSMHTSPRESHTTSSRCHEHNCRILCNDTVYDNHEDEILQTVMEAELFCQRLTLVFHNPIFKNGTLPQRWMSRLRTKIHKLLFSRGNLRFITPGAFMTQYAGNIEIIGFRDVTLRNWKADTLVGLTNLRELYVRDCKIINAEPNVLQSVDTLEELVVSESGFWNPSHFTGVTDLDKLSMVDLSYNRFGNIIANESFTGLKKCQILYLNSCNITAIGAGAFDTLVSIEVIYLNNNLLVTIPSGLFDVMYDRFNPKPRINLQYNQWDCTCDSYDLRALHTNGLLYVDPTCRTPEELHGKTFSDFDKYCHNSSYEEVIVVDMYKLKSSTSNEFQNENSECDGIFISNNCSTLNNTNKQFFIPGKPQKCNANSTPKYNCNHYNTNMSESDQIKSLFLMNIMSYYMALIESLTSDNHSLIMYRASCPNDLFFVNTSPNYLRVYDIDLNSNNSFCSIELRPGRLRKDMCVNYSLVSQEVNNNNMVFSTNDSIILYFCTGLVCLAFGAAFVYGIIRYNPVLLKGSKRLLFVKHKNVDALVLPPKVPLRNSLSTPESDLKLAQLSFLSNNENTLSPRNFVRMKSTRSDKSTVSYISALQPTEDQLAEWRERRSFDNNLSITPMNELSIFSWGYDDNSSCSPDTLSTCTVPYGSMK